MPEFEHNDLALVHRQFSQAPHRGAFLRRFIRLTLEPTARFQLPRQAPPKAATEVQGPVAKTSDTIVLRLRRGLWTLKQRRESFLQHVFRLAVAQPQRAPV